MPRTLQHAALAVASTLPSHSQQPPTALPGGRGILRLTGTAGLMALGAGTLLIWSARWFWLGEVAASFAWYLGLAGLFGAGLLLLQRRPMAGGLAVLLSLLHCGPELWLWVPTENLDQANGAQELTIATCNLLWHNHEYEALSAWIERNDPDIIAFQEVSPHTRAVLDTMKQRYPTIVYSPPIETWNTLTWGTAFLARVPVTGARLIPIPGGDLRPVLELETELAGVPLVLRTVHPTRPGREARTVERNMALKAAARPGWTGQRILLGDLNVTSTSPVFKDLLNSTGLRDSRQGFGRQPSYRIKQPVPGLMVAIDHVLVSERIVVLDRRIDRLPGSDHFNVIARIGLRPAIE